MLAGPPLSEILGRCGEPAVHLVTGPVAHDLVHPGRHAARGAQHRLDGRIDCLVADVAPDHIGHPGGVQGPERPMPVGIETGHQGPDRWMDAGIANKRRYQHRLAGRAQAGERLRHGLPQRVEVIDDEQEGTLPVLTQPGQLLDRPRRAGAARADVPDLPRPGRPRGHLREEPGLPDPRDPGDDHHRPLAPPGPPPRAAKPANLVLPADERFDRLELGGHGALRGRDDRHPGFRGGSDGLDQPDRGVEPLELDGPAVVEPDPVQFRARVGCRPGHEHLSGRRGRAQTCGHVQRPPAKPVLHGHGLARVDPDPDGQRELWVGRGLLAAGRLQLDGRPDRGHDRVEHRQRFVAAELDDLAAPGLDRFPRELRELRGQASSRLVATFAGERRVSADVADQERANDGAAFRPLPLRPRNDGHSGLPMVRTGTDAGKPRRSMSDSRPFVKRTEPDVSRNASGAGQGTGAAQGLPRFPRAVRGRGGGRVPVRQSSRRAAPGSSPRSPGGSRRCPRTGAWPGRRGTSPRGRARS